MTALNRIKQNNPHRPWYFHYYGEHGGYVREEALRYGLLDRVVIHGSVPRREALSAVRGAGVTVVITTVHESALPEEKGIVPGKIFETIGLGSPTLVIAPAGSN